MTDVTTTPPPTVETHDPLPESNWLWRRVFIFAFNTAICVGIWRMVQAMVDLAGNQPALIVGAFVKIIMWLLLFAWFSMTYYMIAPTGEQVVKMWQSVNLFKSGVTTSTTQTATASDGSHASATTTTGIGTPPPPTGPAMPPPPT